MSTPLVDRIDKTREKWAKEIKDSRELISVGTRYVPLDRMIIEFDYLLVEAKIALERMNDE